MAASWPLSTLRRFIARSHGLGIYHNSFSASLCCRHPDLLGFEKQNLDMLSATRVVPDRGAESSVQCVTASQGGAR